MKSTILLALKYLGLFRLAAWLTRDRLRILGYHGIWFLDGHYGNHLFMSPEKFRARMRWLKRSRYAVVPLDRAVEDLKRGKVAPFSTVITIDDGWYGTYRHMLPALEETGLPATLYVYTGAVDAERPLPNVMLPALTHLSPRTDVVIEDRATGETAALDLVDGPARARAADRILAAVGDGDPSPAVGALGFDYGEIDRTRQFGFMTYDEIADANRRGLDVQLHTHTHNLDATAPEKVAAEIATNREKLRPHVASTLVHFCYPSGVNSPEMHTYLAETGVVSATLVDTGLAGPDSSPFALKRILDGEAVSQIEFEAEMSGLLELARRAKARLGR